jgi:hypothetical protein
MRRFAAPLIAVAALLAGSAPARTARADGVPFGWPQYAFMSAPASILPSEGGVILGSSDAAFVFGWSWQVPFGNVLHHRIAGDVDFVVRSTGVSSARGRVGYRYAGRHFFGGAGAGIEPGAVTVSPEVGVKFAHFGSKDDARDGLDSSFHLVVRPEVAVTTGHLETTILLGWNLF